MIKDCLYIYNSTETLSEGFTRFVAEQVLRGKECASIALSGGATPKALFDYWSRHEAVLQWNRLLFFWGDERCVPPANIMSNYGMTKKYLLDNVAVPTENIFRIAGENVPEKEAMRYANLLSARLELKNKEPLFDLVMLGLGDDGHTVSIFPYQLTLWDNPSCCVVAAHPETGMKRISITGKIVNNAQHVAFLVTGENKAEKVRDIIRCREEFINIYPAARVQPLSQEIHWFLDKAAAKEI